MGALPSLGGPPPPPSQPQHERSSSHGGTASHGNGPASQQLRGPSPQQQPQKAQASNPRFNGSFGSFSSVGPPQLGALPFQTAQPQQSQSSFSQLPSQQGSSASGAPQPPTLNQPQRQQSPPAALQMAPPRPVFGVTLTRLYERDGLAVPMVVYQCIQALDLFGLNLEGIYRLSGSVPHVNKLKNLFDTGMQATRPRVLSSPLDKLTNTGRLRLQQPRLPKPRELLPRRQQRGRPAQAILPGPARPAPHKRALHRLHRSIP